MTQPNKQRDVSLLLLGAVLIAVPIALAHLAPATFDKVSLQMRVLTALGGGLLGTAVPGLVGIEIKGIRALGAVSLVVIFFLLSPGAPPAKPAAEPQPTPAGAGAEVVATPPPAPAAPTAGRTGGSTYTNSTHIEGPGATVNPTYDQRRAEPAP